MTFNAKPWSERFGVLGDEAEGKFETYCADTLRLNYERFGLNRPALQVHRLPTRIRYTPDYLLTTCFVEVQGLGRDQTCKLKVEKLNCLHWWNDLHPVNVYVWDRTNERESFFHLFEFDRLINEGRAELGRFSEGKGYFAFQANDVLALAA